MFFTPKRLTLISVALALFMDVLDSNIINTSIPAMAHSLHVEAIDLKIALISYLLSLAVFIPISGWTADKYGTKPIFIAAFGIFTVSSFFCGYAHNLYELIVARTIQGIGGAFMISLGRLIIARLFKRHELVEAMNMVIIVVSLAVMLGPFIGGFITQHWSWPWIFWINIPVGIVAILLAYFNFHDETQKQPRPFDLLGFILFGSSLALLCFSLSDLSESNANIHLIIRFLITASLLLIFYFIHAKRIAYPVIKIQLLTIRTFRVSVFGNLCARLGFGGMPFLLPLMQQIGLGFSPQLSGLLVAPMALGIIIAKLTASRILRKVGYKIYLVVNTCLVAIILWMFQMINTQTSVITIACFTFVFGIVLAAQFTAMNSLAFADIQEDDLSASTSLTSTVQILSQSFGVAAGAIFLRIFSASAGDTSALTMHTFHQAFLAMGLITMASACIFLGLKKADGYQLLAKQSA